MEPLREIVLTGLETKEGSAAPITIFAPENQDGTYCCKAFVPGAGHIKIYGENALSALISTLRIIETQVYDPSPSKLIMSATTLTEDDYPELAICVRQAPE
ncbi:MAG: hypothetical protein U5N55_13395 [Cypionkella sp.]|nr:hypothetical protein [Cypionkella sp.]